MMIVSSLDELRAARLFLDGRLGLVPTMGYLHEGHLSLARRAREECDSVVASIFVNPTQFGPTEDLSKYPRDLDRDLSLLEAAGVDLVWTPDNETIYPPGFSTWVEVEGLTKPLEGAARPGHFRGVTTVVAKLFNAVQPQAAYFGQKDAQQAAVVRKMTRDLNFPVEIVVCPTVREADGLAMSSRNSYLSSEERKSAVVLFRALTAAREAFERGERDAESLRKVMSATLASEPRARTQYVSCADYDTLEELGTVTGKALLSMAVFIGKTRLIDNFVVGS
ncbi:MAG: pantoate--beta-alanine ligase [Chloroflexi bacterium]|nr:pantoate--beta-alanine ligase [Anaerolineae bacterium]MBL1172495.1 pantoate--beta-alanine ligase [Chloroflexota bacterium]MDL1926269.1 pantoate--beta-alanine ligase [Anaerolineae bacterium AMX1]NOG75982.1 pantoate--beta-alanine ligase [Chloroflexota bacterium]